MTQIEIQRGDTPHRARDDARPSQPRGQGAGLSFSFGKPAPASFPAGPARPEPVEGPHFPAPYFALILFALLWFLTHSIGASLP